MQTNKIQVGSNTADLKRAMMESENFARQLQLNEKNSLRLQLLTEELLALPAAIVGEFEAEFWLEGAAPHSCQLHLDMTADMDYSKRQDMVQASTSKKNSADQSFLDKLRDFVEDALFSQDTLESYTSESASNLLVFYGANRAQFGISWSLNQYRSELEHAEDNDELEAAWDELKKSMLAKIADDVQVAAKGNQVHLVVKKTFTEPQTA